MKGGLGRLDDELQTEPVSLSKFAATSLPKAPEGSIFVGAGDSYAAALAGYFASDGRCLGLDPYALASNPQMARNRDVFFISASGRTSSNIGAARKVKRYAARTTSITAVRDSVLATLTDAKIELPMKYAPKSPGMLSFCLSLLAVLKLVGQETSGDFAASFRKAKRNSSFSFVKGVNYFLGNSLAYPVAIYAAAKTYELLGLRAQGEQLEEFSHMQLFSLTRSDVVYAFSAFDPSDASKRLTAALRGQRYASKIIPDLGSTLAERLFYSVFVVQLSVISEARLRGLSEPKFLADKGRLAISDSMIY